MRVPDKGKFEEAVFLLTRGCYNNEKPELENAQVSAGVYLN